MNPMQKTAREKLNVSALGFLLARITKICLTNAMKLKQAGWCASTVSQFSNFGKQSIHLLVIFTLFIMLCTR